ncbi:uncharacterized protein LOC100374732 [Saccoglossus kowalevskii]|uniref:Uncharacterized protein LOC100374732 n=1 Tax=Saccoglossus kowalevskii TaxID=10224 RepID=A0ABM0MEV1_SACKO|nr:PREDICTED: uncharacterized protein LOC100374732 [Saccoglossus kowalevskii]
MNAALKAVAKAGQKVASSKKAGEIFHGITEAAGAMSAKKEEPAEGGETEEGEEPTQTSPLLEDEKAKATEGADSKEAQPAAAASLVGGIMNLVQKDKGKTGKKDAEAGKDGKKEPEPLLTKLVKSGVMLAPAIKDKAMEKMSTWPKPVKVIVIIIVVLILLGAVAGLLVVFVVLPALETNSTTTVAPETTTGIATTILEQTTEYITEYTTV